MYAKPRYRWQHQREGMQSDAVHDTKLALYDR